MSWYKDNKNEWKEIIETVAREEKRTVQMVEKDTIQSMFLYELSKESLPFVFKGGTSLSKVYRIINRFSEDIDLSMTIRPTESEKKQSNKIIMEIADRMGLLLTNPDAIQSRYNYNKYVFEFHSLFAGIPQEIIIETSYYQKVYPVEVREVKSYIGAFCVKQGIELPIPFEATEFNMLVQSLERTFIDKVFAVCDYKIQDMQDRDSRHLYDIAKILPEIELSKSMVDLIDLVRKDRMLSKNNPSAQPQYNITEMLKEIIRGRFYEMDYNSITKKLLYEDISYDEAVEKGIAAVARSAVFDYRG